MPEFSKRFRINNAKRWTIKHRHKQPIGLNANNKIGRNISKQGGVTKYVNVLRMDVNKLDSVFNPSDFGVYYPQNYTEEELLNKDKKEAENSLYEEVISGLKRDMSELGFKSYYSSEILIREVAMNILLMNRIKSQIICKGLLRDEQVWKRSYTSNNKDSYTGKSQKSISYDYYPGEQEIHPLFDRLIPKLQKQINEGLRQLGLLPYQQIERQKVVLVEKLKKRLMEIKSPNETYTADAIFELKT